MNETAVKGLIALALASVSAYFHDLVVPVALLADSTPTWPDATLYISKRLAALSA